MQAEAAPQVSLAHRLAALPAAQLREVLADLPADALGALSYTWEFWRRRDQTPPEGEWRVWALIAGRGAGKTWTGAQWVRSEIESGRRRCIALVAPTHLAGRKVMIEGASGLLSVCPPGSQPTYEMATGKVTWPNSAAAHLISAETPDRARGYNFDGAWCDELATWDAAQETWDQIALATRITGPRGHSPCIVVTTTPKPTPLLKAILADPGTRVSRASTFANAANLDPAVLAHLQARYGGTGIGRQELLGELLENADGALWTREMIDAGRIVGTPAMKRIVVAIDPSGGAGRANDETGIIVAGIGADGAGYVLQDLSGKFSPERWARRAVEAYAAHSADRIVAESNFGGAMVESTLRAVAPEVPLRLLHASRGKAVRAEPVAALYEQGRVHHVGQFPQLEDQLCTWEPLSSSGSPDRLDALVWAMTELMLTNQAKPARWLTPAESYRLLGFTLQR